jgi:hypothetical protein
MKIQCFLLEKTDERIQSSDGINSFALWKRADTGGLWPLHSAPAGAIWFAPWMEDHCKGFDGKCLVVRTPGGDWMIDSRASNCGLPNDTEHRCWIRHGEAPNITVDKQGKTCSAGAGSIVCGKYHGFLRNGFLEEC